MNGKNIILGITGGIAAYKSALLARQLVKKGANVKVIMTPLAKEFITPLTMATLTKNPILVDFYNPENGDWNSHVDLGLWADAMLVAPVTANTMGKMANGIADNLLITTYLSAKCPVFLAPAMDLDMYKHPSNQKNIDTLKSYGHHFIEPKTGELASGLIGKGRMEEPEEIADYLEKFFQKQERFYGKKILVTAGPTYEKIDPVRFIGNYSSGKMGFAIAETLAKQGAEVELVTGPVSLTTKQKGITIHRIESAEEMYNACIEIFSNSNAAIMSAAVADFSPETQESQKVKRKSDDLTITLKPTKDIAASLGKIKEKNQIVVGFALETNNEETNAKLKLEKKNLDFIVLNSLNDKGAGFNNHTNKISILDKNGNKENYDLKHKISVAEDICDYLSKFM